MVSDFKNNTIKIYSPSYYFFDETKPIVNVLLKSGLGLEYTHALNQKKKCLSWHTSLDYYYGGIDLKSSTLEPNIGEAISREVFFVNFGIDQKLVQFQKLRITWFGEINGRFGNELIYGGSAGLNWAQIPRDNYDIGFSSGLSINYRFKFGLTFSFNLKQSFYYFVYNDYKLLWYVHPQRNLINLNLGLGWNFGKKPPSVNHSQEPSTLKDESVVHSSSQSILVNMPIYYFYDNTELNIPIGFGLIYSYRFNQRKIGLHISIDYVKNKNQFNPLVYGSVLSRELLFFGAGIDKEILESRNLQIDIFGEFNGRFGSELYQTGYVFLNSDNKYEMQWEELSKNVLDFGTSTGLSISYKFKFGLRLNLIAKQSTYYYLHDYKKLSNIIKPSRNLISLSMGVGWNFGRGK